MKNYGKYLEDIVSKELDKAGIWNHRFPDSKAARGVIAAQPADFLVSNGKKVFLLECKSIKHNYRLKRFAQGPRMNVANKGGLPGLILIHHWETDKYRILDIADVDTSKPSTDMRFLKELDWDEVMEELSR